MKSQYTFLAALVVVSITTAPALAKHGDGDDHGYGHGNGYHDRDHDRDRYDHDRYRHDDDRDHHDHDRDLDNGNWHGGRGNRHAYGHYKNHGYKHYNSATIDNWQNQRQQYRSHWSRVSTIQQQQLDAQMRQQWLAYHNNRWNGNYNWNTYNDPAFLDYLHTSNPGLLTTLRSYLGF
jgi:hypothetical protein